MGATFANIQILNPDKDNTNPAQFRQTVIDELVSLMDTQGFKRVESEEEADRSVIISIPDDTRWISIYDEETSRLESREIDNIAYVLSNNMHTTVLGIMVYDDDMLFLAIYRSQTEKEIFASNEEDFDIDFTVSGPDVWAGILKPGYTQNDIQLAWKERGFFVTRFLQRFSSLTGIPEHNINTGYIYLLDENLPQELFLHFARKADAKPVELGPVKLSWVSMSDSINIGIHAGMQITMTAGIVNKGLPSTGFEVMIAGQAIDDELIRPEALRITVNGLQEPENLLCSGRFYETVSTTGVKLYCATLPDFEIKEGLKTPLPISMKEEQRYYSEMFRQAFNVEMDMMTLKPGVGDFDFFFVPLANRQEGTAHFERREFTVKPELTFRPLEDEDITLIETWLQQDYILRWYHEPGEWIREMRERNGEFSFLHHFLVCDGERPFAFCQYYDCFAAQEEWYEITRPGEIYSIDYLVGDTEYLHRGYGKAIVKRLTDIISTIPGARKVVVQPEQGNIPSVKALLSNGYLYDEERQYYYQDLEEK